MTRTRCEAGYDLGTDHERLALRLVLGHLELAMILPTVSFTQLVIDWITSLGWDTTTETGWPVLDASYTPDMPDQAVLITGTGGPGFVTDEGSADGWSFQARVRGTSDDASTPELKAWQLDTLIRRAPYPATVDGMPIQNAYRAGSPPAPLPVDPKDLRHEFTCSYIIVTGV